MKRTMLAIAAALLAAPLLFVSAAQACISCNYVPEVARTPSAPASAYADRGYAKKRVNIDRWLSRTAPAQKSVAKSVPAARKAATAKTETAKNAPAAKQPEAEDNTADAPATEGEADPADKPKVAESVGCVKFFPSIGKTLPVPCE